MEGKTFESGRALVAAAAVLTLGMSVPAWSQQPPTQQPPQGSQPPAGPGGAADPSSGGADVSDEKLEAFAAAYVEVRELREEYQGKFNEAEGPEETTELRQEAQSKTVEAVEGAGLSPQEYNDILEQVNSNTDVRARTLEKIDEAG